MIQRLAIVGVGLLGGSIALAARAHGVAREIIGIGRNRARLEPPLRAGAVNQVTTDLAAGVRDADLVVFSANVLANGLGGPLMALAGWRLATLAG